MENKIADSIVFPSSVTNILIKNTANAKKAPQINNTFDNGFHSLFVLISVFDFIERIK